LPEISEVARIRKQLDEHWVGKKVIALSEVGPVSYTKFLKNVTVEEFRKRVIGSTVLRVYRIGKHLIFILSSGYMWRVHFNSTGWFKPNNPSPEIADLTKNFLHTTTDSSTRLRVTLQGGDQTIEWNYVDGRTWSGFWLNKGKNPDDDPYLANYGIDWLNDPESASAILLSHRGNRSIKDVLCDQHITSGLGNYLVCEACFLAKVHPHSRWQTLTPATIAFLIHAILQVVGESVKNETHDHWRVFKRFNKPCTLAKISENKTHRVQYVKDPGGQRGSYFCPTCQGDVLGTPVRPPDTLDPERLYEANKMDSKPI